MRIFVSYSLRCSFISKKHLINLYNAQRIYSDVTMYIDLFDNPKGYNGSKKSFFCPAHRHVMDEIKKADIILLLCDVSASPWVRSELFLANKLNIPVVRVEKNKINTLLVDCEKKQKILLNKILTYKNGLPKINKTTIYKKNEIPNSNSYHKMLLKYK